VTAPAAPGIAKGVSGTAGMRRLASLPLQAQSTISGAVAADAGAFAARGSGTGWRLRGGGVRAVIGAAGADLHAGGGTLTLDLMAVGRGSTLQAPAPARISARANRVTLERAHLREWYAAGPLGIEQGFTIAHPVAGVPGRAGASGPLTLTMRLRGTLRATESASQVRFLSSDGRVALRYGGLVARDATGRRLPSTLRLVSHRLTLRVDDRGARYPVQIDPLLQQGSKLTAADEQGEGSFGWSVALSSDGNTAVIGGYTDNGSVGAAWVFTRSGSTWSQQGPKLTADDESGNASFGWSVALSSDGNTALIGGELDNNFDGAAWVFTRTGSTWNQQGAKLVGDCTSGCGGVRGTGEVGTGELGASVALSADGNTALIGADANNNEAGGVWVFTRAGSHWSQQGASLAPSSPSGGFSQFGHAVALSSDGNTALIGGPGDGSDHGAAWAFKRTGTVWAPQMKLMASDEVDAGSFGHAVALSSDGNTALIGGDQDHLNGAAWVFTRAGAAWSQQGAKLVGDCTSGCGGPQGTGGVGSQLLFGYSVSMSADGNTALVGADGDNAGVGAAWVFARSAGAWAQQGAKLTGQGEINTGVFGFSAAMSADGNTALIGGYGDNSVVGAAWAFAPPAPTCADATAATPAGGGTAAVSLTCTAPAGATSTYGIVAGPAHGSLSAVNQANGQLTYTAQSDYAGPDTFSYQLSDQWGVSNVATVTVTVPAFAVPTCANVSARAAKGAARTAVALSCTGPAGTPISYAIVSPPADGTLGALDQATGRVGYTAELGYSGTDRFIYRATDAGGASATASATITIPAANRITSTMGWYFHPTLRTSTVVQQLSVNAVPAGATVKLSCATKGCPIKPRSEKLAHRRTCRGTGKKRKCRTAAPPASGTIDLTRLVKGKHVHVGAQIRVSIVAPAAVGKQYIFTIRPNRQPSVTIVSLAPGGTTPCPSC
jgi:hypothetical protein